MTSPDVKSLIDAPLLDETVAARLKEKLAAGHVITGFTTRAPNGQIDWVEIYGYARLTNAGRPRTPPPRPTMVEGTWRITNHICRRWVCGGRILERMDIRAGGLFRCSRCGVTSTELIEAICACGQRLQKNKDLGVRCAPNPAPNDEHPWEVVYSIQSPEATAGPGLQVALPLVPARKK